MLRSPPRPCCSALALLVVLGLLGTTLPATVAVAAPSRQDLTAAEAMATKGAAYFKSGVYGQAVDAFMQAFTLSGRPLMMYNAARAHEEAGQLAEARALFLRYVGLEGVPADARAEAQQRIANLEARMRANGTTTTGAAAPASVAAEAGGGWPLWRVVGAGALGAGAVATYLIARGATEDANAIDVRSEADKKAYLEHADTARTWRGVSIGLAVGGVAMATWAVVDALATAKAAAQGPTDAEDRHWTVGPLLTSDRTGLLVAGRF